MDIRKLSKSPKGSYTLVIPANMARSLGWGPGDYMVLTEEPQGILISKVI